MDICVGLSDLINFFLFKLPMFCILFTIWLTGTINSCSSGWIVELFLGVIYSSLFLLSLTLYLCCLTGILGHHLPVYLTKLTNYNFSFWYKILCGTKLTTNIETKTGSLFIHYVWYNKDKRAQSKSFSSTIFKRFCSRNSLRNFNQEYQLYPLIHVDDIWKYIFLYK